MTSNETKDNLARIRDNQRRSRARRKEYLQELETKFRNCEQLGVEASAEIQAAARRVLEENKKLRALLLSKGVSEVEIDGYTIGPCESLAEDSPAIQLAELLANRKTCTGKRSCDNRPIATLQISRSASAVPLTTGTIPLTTTRTTTTTTTAIAASTSTPVVPSPIGYTPVLTGTEPVSPLAHGQKRAQSFESTRQFYPATTQSSEMASPSSTITPPDVPTPTFYNFGPMPVISDGSAAASQQPNMGLQYNGTFIPSVEYDQAYNSQQPTSYDMTSSCAYASEILQRMNPDIEPELESQLGCDPKFSRCRVENTKLFSLIGGYEEQRP